MIRSLALLLIAVIVGGHSAPQGWAYEEWCCDNSHCKAVPASDVAEIESGVWKYLPTGNIFKDEPPLIKRIRPSKDKNFHVCIGATAVRSLGFSYCIYIVQGN
jgi:hypothetical protein